MKKNLLYLPLFLLFTFLFSQVTLASEKVRVLAHCERLFGKVIDTNLNLFEFNKEFVVQVKFQGDTLVSLSIQPKYFFNEQHPEWVEPRGFPLISLRVMRQSIIRFEKIKRKGRLIRKGLGGVITNSTNWISENYKDANLHYGKVAELGVRWLTINYRQIVIGNIYRKEKFKPDRFSINPRKQTIYLVRVETNDMDMGHTYSVRKKVYDSLVLNKVQPFEGISWN